MENTANITIQHILQSIKIIHPFWYIFLILFLTILIRLALAFFKAKAIKNGEIDTPENIEEKKWKNENIKKIFCSSFWSTGKDIRIDDYWLPVLIGIPELSLFPILMTNGYWTAIGTWIVIKTASSWGGWNKTRTAYNRFLLGNILSLSCSGLIGYLCFK